MLVWLFLSAGSMALADQQPLMSLVSDPRKVLVAHLHLKMYEALKDPSLCAGNGTCLKHVKGMQSLFCAVDACNGQDKSKRPLDCFEGLADKYPQNVQNQINLWMCPLIRSPSIQTRRDLLVSMPKKVEDKFIEFGAYLLALKGSADSCEDYIKDYVGAYGPKWKYNWYRALSGCRILAHVSTREQEEKDFYTWFGVSQGMSKCSDIANSEMRQACSAPGARSPVPVYER